jgi:hypothetical protein
MRAFLYGTLLSKEAETHSHRETHMKVVLCISYLLLVVSMTVSAQMDHMHAPATAEDCTSLSPELQAVVAAMDRPGSRIEALSKSESSPAVEPGIHKLEVALRPLSEVGLLGKENLSGESENLFGGFVRLTVRKDGIYRVSVDSTLWIDMIDG